MTIATWKDFFLAVEKMRAAQKDLAFTHTFRAQTEAKEIEKIVDAAIRKKRDEWSRLQQPELTGGKA